MQKEILYLKYMQSNIKKCIFALRKEKLNVDFLLISYMKNKIKKMQYLLKLKNKACGQTLSHNYHTYNTGIHYANTLMHK